MATAPVAEGVKLATIVGLGAREGHVDCEARAVPMRSEQRAPLRRVGADERPVASAWAQPKLARPKVPLYPNISSTIQNYRHPPTPKPGELISDPVNDIFINSNPRSSK